MLKDHGHFVVAVVANLLDQNVAVLVLAWLALAWTSLTFLAAVPVTLGISEIFRRRHAGDVVVDDLEDLY